MSMELFEASKGILEREMRDHLTPAEYEAMVPIKALLCSNLPPASTSGGRHGGFPGGLICHIRDVWEVAVFMASTTRGVMEARRGSGSQYDDEVLTQQIINLRPGSVLKVCMLHDLNKTIGINGQPYYIENKLDSGKRSDKKPWKINPEVEVDKAVPQMLKQLGFESHVLQSLFSSPSSIMIREGQISLAVAESASPGLAAVLTPAERHAVIFHDGAFISTRDGLLSGENSLQILLHAADMIASRFLT